MARAPRRRAKALVLAGALALGLASALWIAPWFIPWDTLRLSTAAACSRALGRDVGIGRVDVGLFTGVRVSDISVANAGRGFSTQALFSASEARLELSLPALVRGRVLVRKIIFVRPQLLIETNAQGISNLEGLGGPSAPVPSGVKGPAKPRTLPHLANPGAAAALAVAFAVASPPAPNEAGRTFPLAVAEFEIQDGTVLIRDRRAGTQASAVHLELKLQGVSLAAAGAARLALATTAQLRGKEIPLSLDADFRADPAGQRLDISRLDFKAASLSANLAGWIRDPDLPTAHLHVVADMDLAELPGLLTDPALSAQLQGKVAGRLNAKADVELEGRSSAPFLDRLRADGDFQVKDGVIHRTDIQARLADAIPYAAIQQALRGDITFSTAQGEFSYAGSRLSVARFVLGSGADLRQGAEFIEARGFVQPGKGLDFKIIPHFNPKLGFPGGELVRAFEDAQGWPTLDYIEYRGSSFKTAQADFTVGLQKVWDAHRDQIKVLIRNLPGSLNRLLGGQ
jgi:uncharacterized protein involved in outer membrane biogenesis